MPFVIFMSSLVDTKRTHPCHSERSDAIFGTRAQSIGDSGLRQNDGAGCIAWLARDSGLRRNDGAGCIAWLTRDYHGLRPRND